MLLARSIGKACGRQTNEMLPYSTARESSRYSQIESTFLNGTGNEIRSEDMSRDIRLRFHESEPLKNLPR